MSRCADSVDVLFLIMFSQLVRSGMFWFTVVLFLAIDRNDVAIFLARFLETSATLPTLRKV